MTSAEIWYGLRNEEISDLENLDISLLRKIMGAPVSVAKEALYLELGCLPINCVIKARRINYLHYLATRHTDTMLYQFFITQWKYSSKLDWTRQVKEDLDDFGIEANLDWIKSRSKGWFKNLVEIYVKQKKNRVGVVLRTNPLSFIPGTKTSY